MGSSEGGWIGIFAGCSRTLREKSEPDLAFRHHRGCTGAGKRFSGDGRGRTPCGIYYRRLLFRRYAVPAAKAASSHGTGLCCGAGVCSAGAVAAAVGAGVAVG